MGSEENVQQSKKVFWDHFHRVVVNKKYEIQAITAVDKLTTFYRQAIETEGFHKIETKGNILWRSELDQLPTNIDESRCQGGYFTEYHAATLADIAPVISRKYQTLAYYGFLHSELVNFIKTTKPSGIDRIVPIGKTTDFSLIWDGYDLIRTLSRVIEIN